MDLSKIGRRIAFSLIPVTVVLGSAECGLRVADWPSVEAAFEHNTIYWLTDPNLKEQATPHDELSTTFPVTTDPNGLRYPIHDMDKPNGTFRIMTLGCSTTFGWGVADSESYPGVLESLIRDAGYDHIEVINGGQPGYTSFQGMWLWEEVLKLYQPDLVLIGYVVQDARDAAYTDQSQAILEGDADFLKHNFLYKSKVYLAMRSMLGKVQIRAKECDRQDQRCTKRVPIEDFAGNLRSMVDKIDEVGATPVIFGYPLEVGGYTTDHRIVMEAASEELDVAYLPLQVKMEQAAKTAKMEEKVNFYFPQDPGHATAEGNAWIANEVYLWLKENQWLEAG